MKLEHFKFYDDDYHFVPDFEFDPPVVRWDPKTNRELVGRPTKGFGTSDFYYAGKTLKCSPWETSPVVNKIKEDIERKFKIKVEYVLIGEYQDAAVGIPYHMDEMTADEDLIINLSFGDPRIFRVKWNNCGTVDHFITKNGEMIVFDGYANKLMQHDVPSLKSQTKPRYSLTFRTVNLEK
jgi:alkylated DNA repair dioxygenase AlkB